MAAHTVPLELPDELVALLGSTDAAAAKAREALILELLREARISQGLAARLLGITRWDMLDLMAARRIPSGPLTPEDVQQEFGQVARRVNDHHPDSPGGEARSAGAGSGQARSGGDSRGGVGRRTSSRPA